MTANRLANAMRSKHPRAQRLCGELIDVVFSMAHCPFASGSPEFDARAVEASARVDALVLAIERCEAMRLEVVR